MLKSLNIKNFATISNLNIDFNDGFNVFTGETGAGKSIIVGALSFLIKGRSDNTFIKTGENKAIIEGIFTIDKDNEKMISLLNEMDIDYDDELIVRRVISNDNHNSIKVNQCSVTLNYLNELLSDYVDIHSQRDNQYLFNKKNHIELLDKFADNADLLAKYKEAYNLYIEANNGLNKLLNETYSEKDLDFLNYNLDELSSANITLDEEDSLIEKEKKFKNSEKYLQTLQNALELYDKDSGINDNLFQLIKVLNINDDEINTIKNNIENYYYSINDEITKLKKIVSLLTEDDINIDQIEERLFLYNKLKRKYNTNTEGLINKLEEIKEQIALFENRDKAISEKTKEVNEKKEKCIALANKLHDSRTIAAKKLNKKVIKEAKDLLLNNIVFETRINESDINSNGLDDVEFYVSMNKGEDTKPLKNVASGGEASRLMLALKVIFSDLSNTSLSIFDEIDNGVSGSVALAVGLKIAELAKKIQVLTITHLSPVAACAKTHYKIYKDDSNNVTETKVKKLNYDEIIDELSLISQSSINDASRDAAKILYEEAQSKVNNL